MYPFAYICIVYVLLTKYFSSISNFINLDIEGICFEIDEIDTQQGKTETRMTVGDVMVPVQVGRKDNIPASVKFVFCNLSFRLVS